MSVGKTEYNSKNPHENMELVVCNHCENLQYEVNHPLNRGGKFAWECRSCRHVNEGDSVHILQNTAWFDPKSPI